MSSSSYQTRLRTSAPSTSSVTIEARGQQHASPGHFCAPPTDDTRGLRRSQRKGTPVRKAGNGPPELPASSSSQTRALRLESIIRTLHQQQVSESTQTEDPMSTSNEDTIYEEDLQKALKRQIQPIIQNYVNQTKRPLPIDLSLDMSSLIQLQQL